MDSVKIEIVASNIIIVETDDGTRYRINDRDNGEIGIGTEGHATLEVTSRSISAMPKHLGVGSDLVIGPGMGLGK